MPRSPPTNHFPTKLYELLDEAEAHGHSGIISWCSDGKSFRIHDPRGMVPILAKYFRQTKYKSLLRQLQGYSFVRVTSGENKGNVSHPFFQRGKRHLCLQMKRKQNSTKAPAKAGEPRKSSKDKGTMRTKSANKSKKTPQVKDVATSNDANPVPPVTQSDGSDIQKLESNFRSSFNRSLSQPQIKHKIGTVLSAPNLLGPKTSKRHHHTPSGMDALRVEIGCTFSTSNERHSHKKRVSSASEFECRGLSKRQRSYEGTTMNQPSTSKNVSFPFSSIGGSEKSREDDILREEKMDFEKSQQQKRNFMEFEKLEKLCFSNTSQQFRHSRRSTSAMGTLDLDISLTTTTTTTHHNGSAPEVKSSTVFNHIVLPSQLEPTPIISPKNRPKTNSTSISDGFTLSCDIDFSTKDFSTQFDNKNNMKLPSGLFSQDKQPIECNSMGGDASLGRSSVISDEIDEGIAEAFGGDGNENKWGNVTFESDCEEDDEDWTKGITYEGKTDCVLEPEKFQTEVQQIQGLQHQQKQILQRPNFVQQPQIVFQQRPQFLNQLPPPMQLKPNSFLPNPQNQGLQNPYALLSKPMPFSHQNFSSQIQIQRISR